MGCDTQYSSVPAAQRFTDFVHMNKFPLANRRRQVNSNRPAARHLNVCAYSGSRFFSVFNSGPTFRRLYVTE